MSESRQIPLADEPQGSASAVGDKAQRYVAELEKAFIPLFRKHFRLFQNAQFGEQVETILDRLKYLERIKADIKKEQKQAKKVIINKKNQVIAELRENILNHICTGENFDAIIHKIKKIVVYDLVFWERHIENLKVEVRQDIRMDFRNELQNMKKDLKAELLQELQEQARNRPRRQPSISRKVDFKRKNKRPSYNFSFHYDDEVRRSQRR